MIQKFCYLYFDLKHPSLLMAEMFVDFITQRSPFHVVPKKSMSGFTDFLQNPSVCKMKELYLSFVQCSVPYVVQQNMSSVYSNMNLFIYSFIHSLFP